MDSASQNLRDQISELLKPHRVCLVTPVVLNHSQPCVRSTSTFVVLSLWRGYLVVNKEPVRVESTFSYLEICSIEIHSLTQIVLKTDRQTLSFSVLHVKDLEAMVSHMTASLKWIFPDSSPGKLLKTIPADLQQRLNTLAAVIEEQLNSRPGPCGGFSDTYAALCDFNEMSFREEIQWDVDNIYYIHNCRHFNLCDFSHLDNSDLALTVAALSFNQWFTMIYSKEIKLSADVQEQLTFLLSKSPSLEELSLEASGLKVDFAVKMAAALREHASSTLRCINLSGNPIEDKGVMALSHELGNLCEGLKHLSLSRVSMTSRGLGCLSQMLSSTQPFSASLTHLDLSGNSSCLVSEEATFLFRFLSRSNSLSHLDLSDTNCPLDTLFVSLSSGCCDKLQHLNLARNPFSHRKMRRVTRSIGEFFRQSCELKYVGLSETKLPPQALRLLLQGLATNTRLLELELDLSSCELRSVGAQVIQEHISEATAIGSLDISDNGFENDMVTLVLSLGQCHSLKRLALGRNFAMKSRALTDVLHRIAQLIQDEECPLQYLSVCDSKLKTGIHILLSALGGQAALAELDISGNHIGDTGAKMVAKALINNTRLRTLTWDRNNITAKGYQDVAEALERNFTLQQVSLPLADITQSYRGNPDRTKEALHKIQQCLDRNNQRQFDRVELQRVFRSQQSEKLVHGMCQQLEDSLQHVKQCSIQEVQADILTAQEVLHNARESFKLLPSLYEAGRTCASDRDLVNSVLTDTAAALTNEFSQSLQEMAQGLMRCAESVCPRVVQRSSVCECLSEGVSKRSRQTNTFLRSTLVENTGKLIIDRLTELRETLSMSFAESLIEQALQDLTTTQNKMDCLIKDSNQRPRVPELRLEDTDFPTDDYSPAFWRNSFHAKSLRPASSIKSLLDADWEQQSRDRGERGGDAGEEGGGGGGDGRCGLPRSPTATPLSVTATSPSPSPATSLAPSPPGWRGRKQREEGEAVVDAAAAISGARRASFIPPPSLPLLCSISTRAPEEEAAGHGGITRREAPFPGCGSSPGPLPRSGSPASPMEPLPTQGQTLRHYTASRPRPRRTHTQPPSSRPQEPVSKVENEATEGMGRVDEGVEEFFTKKILPDYALKGRWEESNPAQATPPESSSTPSASTPFSSSAENITSSLITTLTSPSVPHTDTPFTSTDVPPLSTSSTPPAPPSSATPITTTIPTKNIKKKFGDFFAFKRARAGRATKAGGGEGGGGEGVKVKRTSIADLIRPLREAKERERERERDKEKEKERGARSVEDANLSNDAATTEGTIAANHRLAGDAREVMAPANTLTTTTPPSEIAPSYPATASNPDSVTAALPHPDDEVVPVLPGRTPSPVVTSPQAEMKLGGTPYGERRLKATKRSLREGKSQSLILLTGLEPEDKDSTHSKKHVSESTSSFEQRLQVMLHRMGVAKTPPTDTKTSSKDEELRKANSEGAILDKPVPPPTFMKPRTMSTSSADPRHPIRVLEYIRPDPPLHPKPAVPDRPVGPLPPKPAIAAKPPLPTPAAPAGGGACPPFAHPPSSSAERVQLRAHTHDGRPGESTTQNGSQEGPQGAAAAPSPRKELLPPFSSPWRGPSVQDRSEKAQSVTDESLPKPRQHLKPLPQRRAVSVHEDTLAITQELKAVLQRSPIRFRGNRGDLPTCTEDSSSVEEVQQALKASDKRTAEEKKGTVQKVEMKTKKGGGMLAETKHLPPGDEDAPGSGCPSSTAHAEQRASAPRLFSPTAAADRALSTLESPPAQAQTLEKPLVTSRTKSPSTTPGSARTLEKKSPVSPPLPDKSTIPAGSEFLESPQESSVSHKKKSPGTAMATMAFGNSTQERGEAVSKQHTARKAEPADQRTEPALSE